MLVQPFNIAGTLIEVWEETKIGAGDMLILAGEKVYLFSPTPPQPTIEGTDSPLRLAADHIKVLCDELYRCEQEFYSGKDYVRAAEIHRIINHSREYEEELRDSG